MDDGAARLGPEWVAPGREPVGGDLIGVLLEHLSAPGDGVVIQPPVFTRFKPLVLADELHADLPLAGQTFFPLAKAAAGTGVPWAAMHGPLKTLGLAGMSDTLLLTDDDELHEAFARRSYQLHLTRNRVVQLAAMQAGYEHGAPWLDHLRVDTAPRAATFGAALPDPLRLLPLEGAYLGRLYLRAAPGHRRTSPSRALTYPAPPQRSRR